MLLLPTLTTALSLAGLVAGTVHERLPRSARTHRAAQRDLALFEKRGVSLGAPHYSLYLYDGLSASNWPSADKIKPYNRVLLAFWGTSGAQDASGVWAGLSDSQRQSILSSYHDAGIAVMVSAFGDGDKVITNKKDPVQVAQGLAGFVKQNGLDGVDIDFEDFTPLQNDQANALDWLTKFHQELRNQLPSGQYAISSTPTAWLYGSAFGGAGGVFCKLQSAAGSSIDWYNMQFYNGDPNTWDTCDHLMFKSENPAFLSLKEISDQCGISLSQIAIGKLWDQGELAKPVPAQIPSPSDFGTCIAQAKAQINYPETGVMIWYGSMKNWDGAISYLSGTLSSMGNAVISAPAGSSSASGGASSTDSTSSGASSSDTSSAGSSSSPSVSGSNLASTTDAAGNTVAVTPSAGAAPSSGASGVSGASGASGASTPSGSSGAFGSAASGSKSTGTGGAAAGASGKVNSGASTGVTSSVGLIITLIAAAVAF